MKPIFCGNLDFDTSTSELESLFKQYGKVESVDIRKGYAFIYMDDEREAADAIQRLDHTEFGRQGRQLRVEWAKVKPQQECGNRRPDRSRRPANVKSIKTLIVRNLDPVNIKTRDLTKHFEPHGRISHIKIVRNFALIQFESEKEAAKALKETNSSEFMGRVISVVYGERGNLLRRSQRIADREWRGLPNKRNYSDARSPNPDYGRDRDSQDVGRGSHHDSRDGPDYDHGSNPKPKPECRGSPEHEMADSSINDRYRSCSPGALERARYYA